MELQTFLFTLSIVSSSESPMMSSDDLTEGDGVSTIDEKLEVRPKKFLEKKKKKKTKLSMYEKLTKFSYLEYRLEDAQVEYTESMKKFLKEQAI